MFKIDVKVKNQITYNWLKDVQELILCGIGPSRLLFARFLNTRCQDISPQTQQDNQITSTNRIRTEKNKSIKKLTTQTIVPTSQVQEESGPPVGCHSIACKLQH